jgi:hypothetical protein
MAVRGRRTNVARTGGRPRARVHGAPVAQERDPASGIEELRQMAGPAEEPRDLGNFSPEGGPGNQGESRPRRAQQHLPTVNEQDAERQAQGERIRPVPPGRGEAFDEGAGAAPAADDDHREFPVRDEFAADPREVFADDAGELEDEGAEPEEGPAWELEQRLLAQDQEIQRLRQGLEYGMRGGNVAQTGGRPGPSQAAGVLTPEQAALLLRPENLVPFSINENTVEIIRQGGQPAADLLQGAFAAIAQRVLQVGGALFGSELTRIENRFGEFSPVARAVEAQHVQQAFYRANSDLVGYEQESMFHWDTLARQYPDASPEQMIRAAGEATRRYLKSRGLYNRRQAAPPEGRRAAGPRSSGMLGPGELPRRVRPAAADGGHPAGGRLNGGRAPLTVVQREIAQLAGALH